ncbi:endonuclease/exonuclease/phosphatase family protein [Pectobacterium versatile]|uniref:Endonuclease n=1 Tax=Pectobacterium versatile TaxID=2488639 RepID=A0A855MM82_9GAMM|nr:MULTISPECIES: endonuclease/exonuclease/phosphatase family protein [Pectobacterium]MBQ4776442.1 endonuclease [Pectobacterium versatile]MCL6339078.1 endonuclease [Pectobacterium carotovorum subsp. carotovorum]MCL6342967.1 endonuclease [Pectobacterium carotovorum subsp. carotovorum]MCL6399621.1 endonuclease [Pectobacterium carotovorum subsp. carotovorum]POY50398.1 endonuclease [Pectobacterium versatile]
MKIRIASYNVENLFHRTAILNLPDSQQIDALLEQVRQLQQLLEQPQYDEALKDKVFRLSIVLRPYIDIRTDAGTLGRWKKEEAGTGFRINKSCRGRGDWIGEIVFKSQEFSSQQRKNTGKIITLLNADILCAVEVENMDVLRDFNSQVLGKKKFNQFVMIDSPNDPRGIDVACLTRYRISQLRTHIFDAGKQFDPVFSRDCLEVTLDACLKQPIYILCNHFKSQSGQTEEERQRGAQKRRDQSERVAEIVQQTYDLKKDYVVILGDLNEDSSNPWQSLAPLFSLPDLHPVIDPERPEKERYTYYFSGGKKGARLNQLDYIFLSAPLHQAVVAWGIERRGIYNIDKIAAKEGAEPVIPLPEVTSWDTAASDHAALWVEVDIT